MTDPKPDFRFAAPDVAGESGRWLSYLGNERRMSPSIDHFFVRGVAAARGEVVRLRGSDHVPIYAEVELEA